MSAIISDCGRYRYRLERDLPRTIDGRDKPTVAWIMVNPSTADARTDDATIRKVLGFSARGGFGRIIVGNIFAFRSTDIGGLRRKPETAVGPENDAHLVDIIHEADAVVFAWGASGKLPYELRNYWRSPAKIAENLGATPLCLGVCADGHPKHPLMVAYEQPFVPWSAPA